MWPPPHRPAGVGPCACPTGLAGFLPGYTGASCGWRTGHWSATNTAKPAAYGWPHSGIRDDTNWCNAEDRVQKGSPRRMGNEMPTAAGRQQVMPTPAPARSRQSYRHEAFLWRDAAEFVDGLVPFIEDGLAAGEPVLVALVPEHAEWLRDRLAASEAARVHFVDMAETGPQSGADHADLAGVPGPPLRLPASGPRDRRTDLGRSAE